MKLNKYSVTYRNGSNVYFNYLNENTHVNIYKLKSGSRLHHHLQLEEHNYGLAIVFVF